MKNNLIAGVFIFLFGCNPPRGKEKLVFIDVSPRGYSQCVEIDNVTSKTEK